MVRSGLRDISIDPIRVRQAVISGYLNKMQGLIPSLPHVRNRGEFISMATGSIYWGLTSWSVGVGCVPGAGRVLGAVTVSFSETVGALLGLPPDPTPSP